MTRLRRVTSSETQATIAVENLSKNFHGVLAVDDLSFEVFPGRVTGFLGPNGAGKTTTLRLLLGLERPSSGTATIMGQNYASLRFPTTIVGASLDAAFHPGRNAREHLLTLAPAAGASPERVDELLEQVGLSFAAHRRAGGFSLGMRQRLALAATLLGDPSILILDEPANGLDPEGIAWLRSFLQFLASEGRTVLISSHMLSEVEQTVDDVIIISRGRLVHSSTIDDLRALARTTVQVKTPNDDKFRALIAERGWTLGTSQSADQFLIQDAFASDVGHAAFEKGIELHELSSRTRLEDIFLNLVDNNDGASTP